eukprot:NODE_732_length_1386_cov_20.676889_g539_i0.p1 GENE.NODE_732_length_1386_cov_20.676889_g539_i0~~NODE_732_length_1386_cov_20.676889_g539_i0.p1  ORF type:complete len:414 (+),score=112.53 NODE_732_length_1386_cov_20.676889_g539_i0:45-1244(+)
MAATGSVEVAVTEEFGNTLLAIQDLQMGGAVVVEEPLLTVTRELDRTGDVWLDIEINLVPHLIVLEELLTCPDSASVVEEMRDMYCPDLASEIEIVLQCKEAAVVARSKFDWARSWEVDQLHTFALTFDMNAHRFQTSHRALFRLGSRLTHSCSPNTFYSSASGKGCHYALRPIAKGEVITTNYLGPALMLPTVRRQKRLWETKLFLCRCSRCTGPDFTRSVPCPRCHPRDTAEPTLPSALAMETHENGERIAVRYAVWTPSAEPPTASVLHEDPDQGATWACRCCGAVLSPAELGFESALESKLEDSILAIDRRLDNDPDIRYDELMGWFMAALKMLGRRHWSVARVMLLMCEWLETNLLSEEAPKDQRAYWIDEWKDTLQSLWLWFAVSQVCVWIWE